VPDGTRDTMKRDDELMAEHRKRKLEVYRKVQAGISEFLYPLEYRKKVNLAAAAVCRQLWGSRWEIPCLVN
jgi:hypothetical protein